MDQTQRRILFILAAVQLLVVLDSAIINVALPAIKSALNFDSATLQWVISIYVLTFGGFLMFGGRAADLYGRKKVLLIGVGGFALFSLLAGLSINSTMLIVSRALQGLAGAFMTPTALSILLNTFKEGDERNVALSIWGMIAASGAAVGVFLGGLLTQYLGWRWNFFVNVPVGIISIIAISRYIPSHIQESKDKHLDLIGAILITVGIMGFVYALTIASQLGWGDPSVLLSFALSIILIALFVINESKSKHPLVPLSIFKIRNVVGGNLIMLPLVAGLIGMAFFTSLYIQNVLSYSPVLTGLAFLPIPIIIGVISVNAPFFLVRYGFRKLLIFGTAMMALGVFMMSSINASTSYLWYLLPAFVLLAIGAGFGFVSNIIAATTGIPSDEAGLASGLINTTLQVGGALGLAILSIVATTTTSSALANGQTYANASVAGFDQAFLVASVLVFLSFLVAVFVIQSGPKQKKASSHK